MSSSVYNIFVMILGVVGILSIVAAIAFFVAAIIGWRTPLRNRRFRWSAGLFAAALGTLAGQQALLWFVFLPSLGREMRASHDRAVGLTTLTKVGDIAPEYSVVADDGTPIEAETLRGKVVVLNFFATWCGPCIQEMPHLQAISDEFATNQDFFMIVIGREETPAAVAEFKAKHGLTLRMAADPARSAFNRYASESIPRTYVISRNGAIIYQTVGFYPEEISKLRECVAKALNGSE
ncbi:MAG: TlpA family protein disulfide reductase [Planctomycetes bacterium]|nr:TlpA family protein disulfide reductase [Planctomycetota bacterium]